MDNFWNIIFCKEFEEERDGDNDDEYKNGKKECFMVFMLWLDGCHPKAKRLKFGFLYCLNGNINGSE